MVKCTHENRTGYSYSRAHRLGESAVAAAVACLTGGELISADSRQVYRYLDVGTNKAGNKNASSGFWELNSTPQHLIDIVEPSETFNAGDFVERANVLIEEIRSRGKRPVIVGGTGLYIKALIDGLAPMPDPDETLRVQLKREYVDHGADHLYERLKALDADSAEKNRGNPQRLIRALEVCILSGKKITDLQRETVPSHHAFMQFALNWPREELYNNINARARAMLDAGLIEEALAVLNKGYAPDCPGLDATIGYRDALAYTGGEISRTQLETKIALDTRHYAKRQLTWFNRDKRMQWIDTSQAAFDPDKIAHSIISRLKNLDKN